MTTRASIILWSAGSGILLGLFVDAALVGIWAVCAAVFPATSLRQLPRWIVVLAATFLAALPLATGIVGYFEGRLKVD